MNKCVIKDNGTGDVIVEKYFNRLSSQEDSLAISFDGGYDFLLRNLEKNHLYNLEITSSDSVIFTGNVIYVSYNFLMTIGDSDAMVIVDNTVLFSFVG